MENRRVSMVLAAVVFLMGFSIAVNAVAADADDLVAKGKTAYASKCAACHGADPKKGGTLGPAVFGSSKELLEAKLLKNEYPAGYKAKKDTKMMKAMPDQKDNIAAFVAFLNAK